jgi:hypothetical protein
MLNFNKKLLFSLLISLTAVALAFAGPPDNVIDEEPAADEILDYIDIDSIYLQAESLARDAEALSKLIDMDYLIGGLLDTAGLASFKEIIIQENGQIRVLTDSGWIALSSDSIRKIIYLPDQMPHADSRDITQWGQDVIIDEGDRVYANITVVSGDVTVNGYVEGDIVTVSGNIYVNSTGYVQGDAIAVGGRVKKEEGAKITGSNVSIIVPFMRLPRGSVFQMVQGIMIGVMILGMLLSALVISLFPRPMQRITARLSEKPIKSFFMGYVAYISMFIIWLLLFVTVIGIPLALFGEPVLILLLILVAYASANQVIGARLFKQKSMLKSFWYGCLISTAVPFILLFLGFATDSLVLFIVNMTLLGFMVFVFLPFGFGAALICRFGFPPRAKKPAAESRLDVATADTRG